MEAKVFMETLSAILSAEQGFKRIKNPQNEIFFKKSFPKKKLEVIVSTPVIAKKGVFSFIQSKKIQFFVKHDGRIRLRLSNSNVSRGWEKVTKEKAEALIEMAKDIPKCPKCKTYPYPRIDRSIQVNPRGTYFVWYTCPGCNMNFTSTYFSGIKSKLHKFLPVPRRRKK